MNLQNNIISLLNIFLINQRKVEVLLKTSLKGRTDKNILKIINLYIKLNYYLVINGFKNIEIVDLSTYHHSLEFLGSKKDEIYLSINRYSKTLNKDVRLNLYIQSYKKDWYLLEKNTITSELINIF